MDWKEEIVANHLLGGNSEFSYCKFGVEHLGHLVDQDLVGFHIIRSFFSK